MTTSEVGLDSQGVAAEAPTVEHVAKVVGGISSIGRAREALVKSGWRSTIAGNRITVNDRVFAHFINESVGRDGQTEARWAVYEIADRPPVWIVGAGCASTVS